MKLCSCTAVGVALDMCGILLDDGFLCLLWSSGWVRFSPRPLGQLGCIWLCIAAVRICHAPCSWIASLFVVAICSRRFSLIAWAVEDSVLAWLV